MKGITKTANGWRVVARVRVHGKIKQKRQTVQGTKEEAKSFREKLKILLRSGRSGPCSLTPSIKTVKPLFGVYRVKSKFAPFSKSHEDKIASLEKLLGSDCDLNHYADRLEQIIASERIKGNNHQANRFIEISKAAFNVAVELDIVKANPITKKRFPKTKEIARDNYLPEDEVREIILTAAKNRRRCHIARALQFYFLVPCRKSEVVRMVIQDVDLFRNRIRLHNGSTKNEEGNWKPIPPAMRRWFKWRVRIAKSLQEPVFFRVIKGSRKHRNCEWRIVPLGDFKGAWGTVLRNAGHQGLRIHDTRHISATDMVNNGTPRTVVNAVAGWKTDMLRTYYHVANDAALDLIKWPEKSKRETSVKPDQAEAV